MNWLLPEDGLKPVYRAQAMGWGVAYVLFLAYAKLSASGFLFIDYANLMIHEMGHTVFGSFGGYYTTILGGTLFELIVPLACMLFFIRRGETTAVACTAFWTFENLLYIATYMGDARRSALPLVGGEESDWTILFTHWGVLQDDLIVSAWTRGIGWIGMLSIVAWCGYKYLTSEQAPEDGGIAFSARE
jgi:hypothetical protein